MHQYFICNQSQVDSKIKDLTKTGTSEDGWTEFYTDKNTNDNWLLTRYKSEYHGGGLPILKKLPEPTIDQLIDIAITSGDTYNIIGASLELSEREKNKKEDFRAKLLSRVMQFDTSNLSNFEKERFKIIIYESNLFDATNRRDIVGKHFTEIQTDADYFKTNARIAKDILIDIEK